jgi:excisionase family DNA binding protein
MPYHSVEELADRFGVGDHTICEWIRRGDLRAINVARKPGTRPKWRVTPEALAEFELARTPTPRPERTRRRKQSADLVEFIK